MKFGQIVALTLGGVVIALMGYVAISGTSATPSEKPSLSPQPQVAIPSKNINEESKTNEKSQNDELKKIRELEESVKNRDMETSHLYKVRCASCHGYSGEGRIAPAFDGKSEEEILLKLRDYKENRVPNSLMEGLLTNSTDEELNMLAKEIAGFAK
ncbi:MAG: c-type cytochrome [Wolinella sp.]